jgi:hypothetical protein
MSFSPDGMVLASAGIGNTVSLWDLSNLVNVKQLASLTGHILRVNSVALSPDGKMLASGSSDKTSILWDMNLKSWEVHACRMANRNLTQAEWLQYMPSGEPYHNTCPDLPFEPELTDSTKPTATTNPPKLTVTAIPTKLTAATITQKLTETTIQPTLTEVDIPPTLKVTRIPTLSTATTIPASSNAEITTWDFNLVDDFSSNLYGWNTHADGVCGLTSTNIQNSQMLWEIVPTKGCVHPSLPSKIKAVTDFDTSVDLQRLPDSISTYYGITFRYFDKNNYYIFIINEKNQTYSVWVNQSAWRNIIDWLPVSAILPDKVNHMGISARGSNFTFYINNQKVGAVNDAGISSGKVGLVNWVNTPKKGDKSSITADNFELHFNNPK